MNDYFKFFLRKIPKMYYNGLANANLHLCWKQVFFLRNGLDTPNTMKNKGVFRDGSGL